MSGPRQTPRARFAWHLVALGLWLLAGTRPAVSGADAGARHVVGATAAVEVVEADLSFRARVDTGAATTSIHAERIRPAVHGVRSGDRISFVTVNERGDERPITATVAAEVTVRTADASERRLKVPLTIRWKDVEKTVLVTLNDRSQMKSRLLLGRNWLHGDFVVDVALDVDD